jgi:uncharacterized membrane protein YedE/YeeE
MFEQFGFETLTAPQAAVVLGGALGIVFGALAGASGFCLRRAILRGPGQVGAAALWAAALLTAIIGTQGAIGMGWITFADHRFLTPDQPVIAIALGGALFGAGMVLTRGCASRLAVLSGRGNLRALIVLILFAITAHAAMKGALAPLRSIITSVTIPLNAPAWLIGAVLIALTLSIVLRYALTGAGVLKPLLFGLAIGALVPLGWVGTGFVLYDEFDPIALQSLSFTAPAAEALFWAITSTAIPASFGAALAGGVILGSLIQSVVTRSFQWQSFEGPAQTGRYGAGAVMMGFGGVLAGGCTVGAGLSGVATLGPAAILALASIVIGAKTAELALNAPSFSLSAGSSTTRPKAPAA